MPLGEEREAYLVRVDGGGVLREVEAGAPRLALSAADQAADGAGGLTLRGGATVSVRFGPGPFERIEFDV